MTAVDARTGPQDTGLDGAASGYGPPPADILTVTDLSPGPDPPAGSSDVVPHATPHVARRETRHGTSRV